ncbi:MAG: 2-succinyl-5-enolpyruvyl-6-hydroxy-3-cyclohexene-1-carboxylic-acid synthase [Propionibacterium sp.]|nr:MAG: 2-succinyl-5-enolpyruvyl-6-hydroxy-3-cyclohexene-1-carboxylic-acid synthase [Propionibacterium sp.]
MSSWLMAKTIVKELISAGVQDVVLAPGSRNAALAIALAQAEQANKIRLHIRIDERVAGFLALGLAKASNQVVPVICTSGTAVGNLLPAAMEARHSGIGWLLISCDRPAYQVGTGASQTTNQTGILGDFALADLRLSSSSGSSRYWAAGLRRALAAAAGVRTNRMGPAQLNIEFELPILPDNPEIIDWQPVKLVQIAKLEPEKLLHRLPVGPHTVVLAGDADLETGTQARELASAAKLPLFAEPTSNARNCENAISCYRLLLEGELGSQIQRVITFGHPTLSRPVTKLLSDENIEHIVVANCADWFDVGATASQVVAGVVLDPDDGQWLQNWQQADQDLRSKMDAFAQGSAPRGKLSGYTLASAVVAASHAGENLVFGSSNPIRDADLAPINTNSAITWANRGLAGIDGTIATSIGIAIATGKPTTLLLGDLAFQHDLGSLVFSPDEIRPNLRIVVADDNGGSIFHLLEQGSAEYSPWFERVFATPQSQDLTKIAASFGHQSTTITTKEQLLVALEKPIIGIEILIVKIPRDNRRELLTILNSNSGPHPDPLPEGEGIK